MQKEEEEERYMAHEEKGNSKSASRKASEEL